MGDNLTYCPVCKRQVYENDMTQHHWKPKSEGGSIRETMYICTTCHKVLHYLIPIKQVERFRTPKSLECHWLYSQYIRWIRTKSHPSSYQVKKIINNFLDKKAQKKVKRQFKFAS